jgi:TctA family transporter
LAISFGPAEYFALMVLGLIGAVVLVSACCFRQGQRGLLLVARP